MKIDKHSFTPVSATAGKGEKASKSLNKMFSKNAPINPASRSLKGRVTQAKNVTARGNELSKNVGKIVRSIPTPFLR